MTFQELSFHPNVVKPNRTMRRRLVLPAPHAIAFAHVIRLDYCTARNHVSSFLRRALRHLTASSRAFVHAPRTPPHPILNRLSSGIMTVSPAPPFAKVRASYAVVIQHLGMGHGTAPQPLWHQPYIKVSYMAAPPTVSARMKTFNVVLKSRSHHTFNLLRKRNCFYPPVVLKRKADSAQAKPAILLIAPHRALK